MKLVDNDNQVALLAAEDAEIEAELIAQSRKPCRCSGCGKAMRHPEAGAIFPTCQRCQQAADPSITRLFLTKTWGVGFR